MLREEVKAIRDGMRDIDLNYEFEDVLQHLADHTDQSDGRVKIRKWLSPRFH